MGARYPLLTLVFGSLASYRHWRAIKNTVVADFGRIGIGDYEHRMSRTGARCPRPIRPRAAIGPAVDDYAFAIVAHLKRERARVRVHVVTGWWSSPGFDDDQALVRIQSLETRIGGVRERASSGLGLREDQVNQNSVFLSRTIEEGQPPVAVSEKSQHWR